MPIVVRRRNSLRKELLAIILLSVLAGIVGGGLIGLSTDHQPPTAQTTRSKTT